MVYNVLNGPYLISNGRRIIFVGESKRTRKCISYARYLMAEHLGRELTTEETVDHIDEDKLNDCIENYQILSLEENARKAMEKFPAKWYEFVCPSCGKDSKKPLRTVIHNWKQAKSGPYCGKKCARHAQVMKLATMTGLNPVAQ